MQTLADATRDKTLAIQTLNDRLRTKGQGGMTLASYGLAAQEPEVARSIYSAVKSFTAFTPDNDPHGEHDCAMIEVVGLWVLWKIDYFDRSRRFHSPDAADPKVTVRVLTIMLAEEY